MAGTETVSSAEMHEALRLSREAKAATEKLATEVATIRHSQAEQGAALMSLTGAQTQMLVSMAEIKTDLGWIRNDLVRQVSDARKRSEEAADAADSAASKANAAQRAAEAALEQAKSAKAQSGAAPAAKRDAFNAQALSVVAILAAILAGILGYAVPAFGN